MTMLTLATSMCAAADASASRRGRPHVPEAETFLVDPASGAKCLDGSTPRYWVQPATAPADERKWAVHMQGGGWCESVAACAERAYGKQCLIGSSDPACFGPVGGYTGAPFAKKMSLLDVPTCNGARWCVAVRCVGLLLSSPRVALRLSASLTISPELGLLSYRTL